MTSLFISDLHLDERQPDTIKLACELFGSFAREFDELYILGDLVEYWIGDDYCQPALQKVFDGISALSGAGTSVRVMHGNRDFLMSQATADQYKFELITEDEVVIDIGGTPTLLMHGDTLCTDDVEYLNFRKLVRSQQWQASFLKQSVSERLAVVAELRESSQRAMAGKHSEIMDVNQSSLEARMRKHGVSRLIHGHTHRPGSHHFIIAGDNKARHVLGDWRDSGAEVLVCSREECKLVSWPRDCRK